MSDIFENETENSLRKLVLHSTGLELHQEEGLPTKICHKCRYVVELSCDFRNMVTKAHSLLTESNKSEIDEALQDSQIHETGDHAIEHTKNGKTSIVWNNNVNNKNNVIEQHHGNKFKIDMENEKAICPDTTERVRKVPPKHLTCQICLTSFETTEDVKLHVEEHYADSYLTPYWKLERPFECEECKKGPMSKTEVVKHHRRHLDVNPYVCRHPGCNFIGKDQASFRHHAVKHGARSQVCEVCGAAFRRRWELRQHQARAHLAAPRRCRVCRRAFRNHLTYNAHALTHVRPPQYKCEWTGCPKAYRSRTALAAHARAHAGERVFKCGLCVAAYTSQSLLNRHLRMHDRARKSKCDKCAATFDDYGAFYRHRVAEHGPWQPYRCAGCNQGYQSESKLNKHMQLCELAIRIQASTEDKTKGLPSPNDTKTEELPKENKTEAEQFHMSSMQEIIGSDKKILQVNTELPQGQSLLVQPGNVNDLNKDCLVLQELPPEGLLYIEVDPDSEDETMDQSWQ
ncbi:zinc finger protein 888-like [Hyposmocoma kahamanoa]|uniref:zinc finger protein 888-like n=1 Tax=Hyposmocoma kahamanoa TaxID=1477025 RepID=UPI000E6D7A56|nr:zinc finger protein 888-like [Hyposmocoma kahamanoa]